MPIIGGRASLLGSLVAALALTLGVLWATAAGAVAALPSNVGINSHSFRYYAQENNNFGLTEAQAEIKLMAEAGAEIVRFDVQWAWLEKPADDTYDSINVQKLRDVLQATEQHGVKAVLVIVGTPCWAASTSCNGSYWRDPPADPGKYAEFAHDLVTEPDLLGPYQSQIEGVQVWNEPNSPGGFITGTPQDYVDLVQATNGLVTAVRVFTAGLHPRFRTAWINDLYSNGIGGHFDVWMVHRYAGSAGPMHLAQAVSDAYAEFSQHEDQVPGPEPPFWVGEFGWTTCNPLLCTPGVNEQTQAAHIPVGFTELGALEEDGLPYVDGALLYEFRDAGINILDPQHHFGLVRHNWQPKPAYPAVTACLTMGQC